MATQVYVTPATRSVSAVLIVKVPTPSTVTETMDGTQPAVSAYRTLNVMGEPNGAEPGVEAPFVSAG